MTSSLKKACLILSSISLLLLFAWGCSVGAEGGWPASSSGEQEPVNKLTTQAGVTYTGSDEAIAGRLKWKFKTGSAVNTDAVVENNVVYVGSSDRQLYALDASTGQKKWAFDEGGEAGSPAVSNGTVYVGGSVPNLYAIEATSGREKWRFSKGLFNAFSKPLVKDGTLYVGQMSSINAIDISSGLRKWNFSTGLFVAYPPEVFENTVYVPGLTSLYAVNAQSGKKAWQYETRDMVNSAPAFSNGTVYFGSDDDRLYALDASSGAKKWEFNAGGNAGSPVLDSTTVYFACADTLFALDAASGQEKWKYKTQGLSQPQVSGGFIYVGTSDGTLLALDAKTGQKKWTFKDKESQSIRSKPAVAGGIIYFGDENGYIYAVDAGTGKTKLDLICVMVRPDGEKFAPGNEDSFHSRINKVEQYFLDVSRRAVQLDDAIWLTNDGNGLKLQHDDKYYLKYPQAYVDDIRNLEPVKNAIPASGDYTIVALQPGKDGRPTNCLGNEAPTGQSTQSHGWYEDNVPSENKAGSLINMPIDQEGDEVAVLAHEIAHGMGQLPLDPVNTDYNMTPPRKNQLPDLYSSGKCGAPSDYSNISGESWGPYFLMGSRNPVDLDGFSQQWLGWLQWSDLDNQEQKISVPYLDGTNESVSAVPRFVTVTKTAQGKDRKSYVVLEARGKEGHGPWEKNISESGVLIYKMTDSLPGERAKEREGWPLNVNVYKLLTPGYENWRNIDEGYYLKLTSDLHSSNGHEVVERRELKPLPMIDPKGESSTDGVVLRLNKDKMPVLDSPGSPSSPAQDSNPTSTPDLDLHAYLADGTHIGINYETGEFDNPVPESEVSGDMRMDSEWILLPPDKAEGARFEVSAKKTADYAVDYPDIVKDKSLALDYTLEPVIFDQKTDGVFRGGQQNGTLDAGEVGNIFPIFTKQEMQISPPEVVTPQSMIVEIAWWKSDPFLISLFVGTNIILGGLLAASGIRQIKRRF